MIFHINTVELMGSNGKKSKRVTTKRKRGSGGAAALWEVKRVAGMPQSQCRVFTSRGLNEITSCVGKIQLPTFTSDADAKRPEK